MSGICVQFNLDERPVALGEFEPMIAALQHRGIDDRGVWSSNTIAFGHCARWTTPEAQHEKLPRVASGSNLAIVSDARIDNRPELIEQLSLKSNNGHVLTDSDIILAAYEKWGEDCPAKIIGDFVFAIWNERTKTLFCARDPLGVKHFCYYYEPRRFFALASEAKALLLLPGVPRELNETLIGDTLILNYEDKENTPFKNIKRLPATNSLTVSATKFQIRKYWSPEPKKEVRLRSDKQYEEAFRELFERAVVDRMRSAHKVGSMLSGGLDSSSIVCVASKHLAERGKPPLDTFSAVFPDIAELDATIDERRFMQSVIDKCNCRAHFVRCDLHNPLNQVKKLQWHADHPVAAPNVYMDLELYRAAQEQGVRVLLSGTDGDSTVSYGYEDLARFARRGRWLRLAREAKALNKNMPRRMHRFKKVFWHKGLMQAIPPEMFHSKPFELWRVLRGRPRKIVASEPAMNYGTAFNYSLMNPDFARQNDLKNRYFDLPKSNYPANVTDIERHWYGLTGGLFAYMLESLDKLSAAYSVEPRYPFFDRRLIEFCIALPPGQRINNGWTRSIFRRAMNGIIPPDVQWRTDKANIGLSFKINMLKFGRAQLDEAIFDQPEIVSRFINTDALGEVLKKYEANPLATEYEPMFILSTVFLSNWLRQNGFATLDN